MADYLGIHGTALVLRGQRLQVLGANIANADTPNYKAQDLDFNQALRAALSPTAVAGVPAGGDPLAAATAAARFERAASQPSLDGNTVDGDRENAIFAQASLEYRASMSFVESKVRSMLTAITGQ